MIEDFDGSLKAIQAWQETCAKCGKVQPYGVGYAVYDEAAKCLCGQCYARFSYIVDYHTNILLDAFLKGEVEE